MLFSRSEHSQLPPTNNASDVPSALRNSACSIQEILGEIQQKRISEISPDWVESIKIRWGDSRLYADIRLSKKPPAGTVLPFVQQLEQLAGCPVVKNISPGLSLLKESKPKSESISSRDRYQRMMELTLPYGVEISHLRFFQERIGNERVEFLIPHLTGIDDHEEEVERWRAEFSRDYGVDVFPMKDWVPNNLKSKLLQIAYSESKNGRILTRQHLGKLRALIDKFHGSVSEDLNNYAPPETWKLNLDKLVDLTGSQYPWITLDGVKTQDREDILCARMLPSGQTELYIGLIDPTEHAYPGSLEDTRVQKRGMSLYGKVHTVPTFSSRIAYDLASFLPNKERRAVVAKFTFTSEGKLVAPQPEVLWANVQSLGNIPPEHVYGIVSAEMPLSAIKNFLSSDATIEQASRARNSLYWISQQLAGIKSVVSHSSGPQKVKGKGLGHQIVQASMLAFKFTVARYLREKGRDFIANNQGVKDPALARVLETEFNEHGLRFNPLDLESPDGFRKLHQLLNDKKLYRLRNKVLDGRIGKTTFSPINRGKQALRLDSYANFKARMCDGLTNFQVLVACLNDIQAPYNFTEL
ncbi:MAG: RNB domain-containing ribonuclease, partial [Bdellovibrionales bacterium]|nr:RNB domain-containing ribonuclease [Bdellovibrionales bacterium]